MSRKLNLAATIAFCVLILDQVTKTWIVGHVPLGTGYEVIEGFFNIIHGRNTGAAFGFLNDWNSPYKNLVFYAIGLVALGFLYYYLKITDDNDNISLVSLSLILGGALGNITDRLIRGSVVDFLSFHYHNEVFRGSLFGFHWSFPLSWPAFNVADAAISTAVALLIIQSFRQKDS